MNDFEAYVKDWADAKSMQAQPNLTVWQPTEPKPTNAAMKVVEIRQEIPRDIERKKWRNIYQDSAIVAGSITTIKIDRADGLYVSVFMALTATPNCASLRNGGQTWALADDANFKVMTIPNPGGQFDFVAPTGATCQIVVIAHDYPELFQNG